MEFMDLGIDCLRECLDHLDIETLCAVAATCQRLQALAQASFAARKITKIEFNGFLEQGVVMINDERILYNVLKYFGECITSLAVYISSVTHGRIFDTKFLNHLMLHCFSTLRELHLSDSMNHRISLMQLDYSPI